LWGMPETVVEAVTFCSAPWTAPKADQFGPAASLYVADILSGQPAAPDGLLTPQLNSAYLESIGAQELLEPGS
jgi:hypothetical protein